MTLGPLTDTVVDSRWPVARSPGAPTVPVGPTVSEARVGAFDPSDGLTALASGDAAGGVHVGLCDPKPSFPT